MPERAQPEYNCKQLELYAVCRLGLASYRENLAAFTAFKAKYDAALGNDFETAINDAAALPDFQARDEKSESAQILLEKKAKECLAKWQDLKRYIADVQGWEDLQKPKQEAAGSTLYEKAANNNWEVLKGLMETASNFIANNEADLEANGNQPNPFKNQFNTLKQDYCDQYDVFTDATQDQGAETDEKIDENNAIFATLMSIFLDGQAIFRENAPLYDRFVFTSVLKIVRGSQGKTITIDIPPQSFKQQGSVVKNSTIANTGGATLWVASGFVETQPASAVRLDSGTLIDVPENNNQITIFNNDEESLGQCTVRITVS